MRFLWLDINVSYSHTSLALPALHAQIGKDEADVFTGVVFKVLYSTIKKEPFTLLNEILAFKPDFIFSTLWLFNSDYTLRLLRDLKTLNNGVKIVLGGPEFLGNNNSFLSENKHIFAVFRGEGENQFASLASALIKGEGTDKLPGICMLSPEGIYTDNGIAQVKSFPLLKYPESSPFFVWDRAYIQIETSRGCFNRCSFCVSGDCRKIENIDLEEIRRRIENAYRHGVKNIRILDRTFNANSERALQLLELFRDFPEICFHVELHPAFLSPPLKEKLSSLPSSLLHIETGIQSLDDNVLNACRRAGKSRESLEGLMFLTSLKKFTIHADIIAGLPLYTYRQLILDINTLISTGTCEIQLELLKLLPGTAIIDDCDKYGIKYSSLPDYRVLETDSITCKELWRVSVLSGIIDLWYNRGGFREFFQKIVPYSRNFIEDFLSHIILRVSLDKSMTPLKRAVIMYDFCREHYPEHIHLVKQYWIKQGLPEKRYPESS